MSNSVLTPFEDDKQDENTSITDLYEDLEDADLRSQLTQKIVLDEGIFDKFDTMIKNGNLSSQIDRGMQKMKSKREEEQMLAK